MRAGGPRGTPQHERPWLTTGSAGCHLWLLDRDAPHQHEVGPQGWPAEQSLHPRTPLAVSFSLGLCQGTAWRQEAAQGRGPRPALLASGWTGGTMRCRGGPGPHTGGVPEAATPPPSIAPWGPLQGTSTPTPAHRSLQWVLKITVDSTSRVHRPRSRRHRACCVGLLLVLLFWGVDQVWGGLLSRHMGALTPEADGHRRGYQPDP